MRDFIVTKCVGTCNGVLFILIKKCNLIFVPTVYGTIQTTVNRYCQEL